MCICTYTYMYVHIYHGNVRLLCHQTEPLMARTSRRFENGTGRASYKGMKRSLLLQGKIDYFHDNPIVDALSLIRHDAVVSRHLVDV